MPSLDLLQALAVLVGTAGAVYGVIVYGRSQAAQKSEEAWRSVAEARDEALKDIGERLLLAEQRAETLKAEIARLEQRPDLTELLRPVGEVLTLVSELKEEFNALAERWG